MKLGDYVRRENHQEYQLRSLIGWEKVGEITPEFAYEKDGFCAPGALVRNDTVHLFYQSYGDRRKNAICHAYSVDGVNFTKNDTNPIFKPTGDWTIGRAIDAEVIRFNGAYYLYFATRDTTMTYQVQGVEKARGERFDKGQWEQLTNKPIL